MRFYNLVGKERNILRDKVCKKLKDQERIVPVKIPILKKKFINYFSFKKIHWR